MQEIHFDKIPYFGEGSILTLGNFDGIHLGHISLLKKLKEVQELKKIPSVVVTYFPNPSLVLGKNKNLKPIYNEKSKLEILKSFSPDYILTIPFTEEFSKNTASYFLEEILLKKVKAKHIIIGFNHFFGKGREGSFEFLKQKSSELGFTVEKIEPVFFEGEQVSSSYIRNLISEGDVEKANSFLTREFHLTGKVVKGFQRGRTIGFPTANLEIGENLLIPKIGVYAVNCIYQEKKYGGMLNIGFNPTFSSEKLNFEVNLFDFDKEIYGEELKVEFLKYIRAEKKFNSIDELKKQLENDKLEAKKILSS